MGKLTPEQRSYCMSRITSKNTLPELRFRTLIWQEGVRGYRLHRKLAGKPDLYFGSKKLAVFIDGCFWHHCPKCFVKPKSNNDYWDAKMARNKKRDRQVNRLLKAESITVMRFWEHDIKKNPEKCLLKLQTALL
jgi:DNA mismatch endonuclease (patch repair protein)